MIDKEALRWFKQTFGQELAQAAAGTPFSVDLLVAISNCPQQRNPCNAFVPTELQTLVYEPARTPRPTEVRPTEASAQR